MIINSLPLERSFDSKCLIFECSEYKMITFSVIAFVWILADPTD